MSSVCAVIWPSAPCKPFKTLQTLTIAVAGAKAADHPVDTSNAPCEAHALAKGAPDLRARESGSKATLGCTQRLRIISRGLYLVELQSLYEIATISIYENHMKDEHSILLRE